MKRIAKTISLYLLFCLLILAAPMASCSAKSQKAQVRQCVNRLLKSSRKMKLKKMKRCFTKQQKKKKKKQKKLFSEPKRFYKIIRPYSRKMTWKIKKIKIKSKTRAVVRVRIKFESLYLSYRNALEETQRYAKENGKPMKKAKKYLLNTLQNELAQNGGKKVQTGIRIKLRKTGGKWKIVPNNRLMNVLLCDYYYAKQDFYGLNWEKK